MRILCSLTYYTPNVSGLTIYVERLAAALAARGHQVTVLTSRHDKSLPEDETESGVRIVRVSPIGSIGKAQIMPRFADTAVRLARKHDLLSLHLPQLEAALAAGAGRVAGKPVILTYHCDLQLPEGTLNAIFDQGAFAANLLAGKLADWLVAYTRDYAENSRFLQKFPDKITVIPPPVVMRSPSTAEVLAFRNRHQLGSGPVLGFASRLAAEKGIDHAIDALPSLLSEFPSLQVVFAGPHGNVIGESGYRNRIYARLAEFGDHWKFVGTLGPEELPAFYGSLDALLLTSVNSTESFGLVQVEAMLCGTPVVATDLPGVRQPVRVTGMGEVVPVADILELERAISRVVRHRQRYLKPREEIEAKFDLSKTFDAYESLFEREVNKNRRSG
jgi:glycosyltransferase involved in cell wall biosynthesis